MEKLQALEVNGRIHFGELPVLEPRIQGDPFEMAVRCHGILRIFLQERMMEEDYILDRSRADETCVVHCLDGNFTMPDLSIVFQEET